MFKGPSWWALMTFVMFATVVPVEHSHHVLRSLFPLSILHFILKLACLIYVYHDQVTLEWLICTAIVLGGIDVRIYFCDML